MEASIGPPLFGVKGPPKPYPEPNPDRDGNYNTPDVDYSKVGTFSSEQISLMHARSDVDSSTKAQHHTLGTKRNNAAQGDHIHDGLTSKKIGQGAGIILTGAKGGNVALTNLINMLKPYIEFTDSTT